MKTQFEFLGLKNNPFFSKELKGKWLDFFYDRDSEVSKTCFFIEGARTIAICGKQGIGKSSFLSYLNEVILPKQNILSLKFNFDFEKIEKKEPMFFLRLLLELLLLFEKNQDNHPKLKEIDYEYEKSRINRTMTLEENVKGNLFSSLIKAASQFVLGSIKNDPIHNNETIKRKIIELGSYFDEPIVLLIDELDKTGKFFQDNFEWANEIYLLLRQYREIFENSNFIFIFALDEVFYEKCLTQILIK
ncbi:MAG: hypothetical protein OMM_13959, partial [Candidatus Magnetoglobus multicellularis str. Araruama]